MIKDFFLGENKTKCEEENCDYKKMQGMSEILMKY